MNDDEDRPVIYLVNCCQCGRIVDAWCEYDWGPVCLPCDSDEEDADTPLVADGW